MRDIGDQNFRTFSLCNDYESLKICKVLMVETKYYRSMRRRFFFYDN